MRGLPYRPFSIFAALLSHDLSKTLKTREANRSTMKTQYPNGFRSKVSKKNSTQLVTATLKSAYQTRSPGEGLIFHSDRGSQHLSHAFCKLLNGRRSIQLLFAPGQPHDNPVDESFIASLKKSHYTEEIVGLNPNFRIPSSGMFSSTITYDHMRPCVTERQCNLKIYIRKYRMLNCTWEGSKAAL